MCGRTARWPLSHWTTWSRTSGRANGRTRSSTPSAALHGPSPSCNRPPSSRPAPLANARRMAVGGRRVVVLADVPAEELRKAGVPEDVGSALVWTVATSHTAAAPTTDRLPSTQTLPAPAFIGGVAAAVLAYVRVRCCRSDQDALFSLLTLRAGCRGARPRCNSASTERSQPRPTSSRPDPTAPPPGCRPPQ